ncbi:hypothetical protein VWZ88_12720 [Phaeobacter sp. JH20_36]|uniref:hypothetical protein n=1 Tax=unclassified Phaeobacter TaxID=2621772 RepID=UPI003A89FA14
MTDTSKEAELLPCPFCGSAGLRHTCLGNRVSGGPPWYETKYRVSCSDNCACSSKPCVTQDEADADWNTRTDTHRAQLRAARDEALEEAAYQAQHSCLVPPDGGSPTAEEVAICDEAAKRIRALKYTSTEGEG